MYASCTKISQVTAKILVFIASQTQGSIQKSENQRPDCFTYIGTVDRNTKKNGIQIPFYILFTRDSALNTQNNASVNLDISALNHCQNVHHRQLLFFQIHYSLLLSPKILPIKKALSKSSDTKHLAVINVISEKKRNKLN